MINCEIEKMAKYLVAFNSSLSQTEYESQLNIIYGAIYEFGFSSPNMFDEIVSIEQERAKSVGKGIISRVTTPQTLVLEYSKIAFLLARKSFETNTAFEVAKPLKMIFSELISSNTMTSEEVKALKVTLSETELDYEFAAGNHNVSSLRMAQILRETK